MNVNKIYTELVSDDYSSFEKSIISEQDLLKLSMIIQSKNSYYNLLHKLVINIPVSDHDYDWNVGSLLQHFEPKIIIDILNTLDNKTPYYNSIGLAWCLGEFNNKNNTIVDFLYGIVWNANNATAWWTASFSLERIGLEEAVNLMKRSIKDTDLQSLDYYLDNLDNRRSIISILVLSNTDNIEKTIYPRLKSVLMINHNTQMLVNCSYLIGRLQLYDNEIINRLLMLAESDNYELRHNIVFALQNSPIEIFRNLLENMLSDDDPLIRKMCAIGLRNIGNKSSVSILSTALFHESNKRVIEEITSSIYYLSNFNKNKELELLFQTSKNENGMIGDESDKWYGDPSIYHRFSEAEDPDNICFNLIREYTKNIKIINPIDIATGTGRMAWQIANKLDYSGELYAIDASQQMIDFLQKRISRERKYTRNINAKVSKTIELNKIVKNKSSLVISSFGFPSKTTDKSIALKELKAVYKVLRNDGVFITIGWDETFNDELNEMWYRYLPDDIKAKNFEEWRSKRISKIYSPRNCNLTWWKTNLHIPLQFNNLEEASQIIGNLFGRDAARHVVINNKKSWNMSMGITIDDKNSLRNAIAKLESKQ